MACLGRLIATVLACIYLALTAQPDMNLVEERDENTDAQAAEMMIGLINKTRRSLVIHDDGNNSPQSVYNSDAVIDALRQRIGQRPRLSSASSTTAKISSSYVSPVVKAVPTSPSGTPRDPGRTTTCTTRSSTAASSCTSPPTPTVPANAAVSYERPNPGGPSPPAAVSAPNTADTSGTAEPTPNPQPKAHALCS